MNENARSLPASTSSWSNRSTWSSSRRRSPRSRTQHREHFASPLELGLGLAGLRTYLERTLDERLRSGSIAESDTRPRDHDQRTDQLGVLGTAGALEFADRLLRKSRRVGPR